MATIQSVPATPSPLALTLQDQARALFHQYGNFLRATQSCGFFNYAHFEDEIATLPTFYTNNNGELLLAQVEDIPAACIAYRASQKEGSDSCEIKRLFVLPAFRGQGLARLLVADVLARAIARNFTRAILDTDLAHMPGAFELYTSFGFQVYAPQQGSIAFLQRALP